MTAPRKEWMRVSEVIKHFGLPRQRVYGAIKSGELPAANLSKTKRPSYLVAARDVDTWLYSLMQNRVA